MSYIRTFDDVHRISSAMSRINRKIEELLPSPTSTLYTPEILNSIHPPLTGFLYMMQSLERFYFMDKYLMTNTYNGYLTDAPYYRNVVSSYINSEYYSFIVCECPRTRYEDFQNSKHLQVAEETIRTDSNHFLKVSTINRVFTVFTNKPLTLEQITKLKMLQWSIYKDGRTTPKEEPGQLLEAILEKDITKCNEIIDTIIAYPEIKQIHFEELAKMFQPNYQARINRETNKIRDLENRFMDLQNHLSATAIEINEINEKILFLKEQENKVEDNSALMIYLMNHPYIKNITKYDTQNVDLYYEAPILDYDPYIINRIIKNHNDEKKKILRAFLDDKYQLMTRCRIRFNTQNFNVRPVSIGTADYIGHPHLDTYECTGTHAVIIDDIAQTGDYHMVIDHISQMVLNLNFSDSVVIQWMLNELIYYPDKLTWFSKETGELVTTRQIMEEYNEETEAES